MVGYASPESKLKVFMNVIIPAWVGAELLPTVTSFHILSVVARLKRLLGNTVHYRETKASRGFAGKLPSGCGLRASLHPPQVFSADIDAIVLLALIAISMPKL
jgi:hypothetical protein